MPGVARLGDRTRVHKPHKIPKPRVISKASRNVMANGRPVARLGDKVSPFSTPAKSGPPHLGAIIKGKRKVLVNYRPVATKGGKIVCGERIRKGSRSVIV